MFYRLCESVESRNLKCYAKCTVKVENKTTAN